MKIIGKKFGYLKKLSYFYIVNKLKIYNMKKTKYFKRIHKITSKMREKGYDYIRIYSEPRKTSGYRTKIYGVREPKQVIKLIKKMFGDKFNTTIVASQNPHWRPDSVNITPKKRVKNEA